MFSISDFIKPVFSKIFKKNRNFVENSKAFVFEINICDGYEF